LSDEFLRIAKKEVADDIAGVGNLLKNCTGDDDVFRKAPDLEKHVHKIKGLAPMMGQDQIGQMATMLDGLLKAMIGGKQVSWNPHDDDKIMRIHAKHNRWCRGGFFHFKNRNRKKPRGVYSLMEILIRYAVGVLVWHE
jgi:hypothetical protein